MDDSAPGPQNEPDADGGSESPRLLEVGRITRAHGLKGDVVVKLSTDRDERVQAGAELFADDGRVLTVVSSRKHADSYIVRFEDVAERVAAESLRGELVFAEPLDDDSVLWIHELIGVEVRESDQTVRGVVVSVEANPASDLLVLDSGGLVPLTFVVDGPTDGVLTVDTPPGLFDV